MRYQVHLSPDLGSASVDEAGSWVVDVTNPADGAVEVRVDGRVVEVDVTSIGRQSSVRVGGRIVNLTTHGKGPVIGVVAGGLRLRARLEDERSAVATPGGHRPGTQGKTTVTSPMPGRVVKVLVAPGDVVAAGQPLLVLEAMKMEDGIRGTAAGTVEAIHVSPGTAVEHNALLVTLA